MRSDDSRATNESDEDPQVEYVSLRQLNEERLRALNYRKDDSTPEPEPEREGSKFANFQASVPEVKPSTPLAAMHKKFSSSWVSMQNYLGERGKSKDWDTKFR